MKNDDLKSYFNDILKINPSLAVNIGLKSPHYFSHIENDYSDEYITSYKNILNKYKNTDDISLKFIIDNELEILKYNFVQTPLYSFENPIINFDYMNNFIYPKNKKYLKSRINDFNNNIETYIMRMREGIKKNIMIPKIICKILINDLSKPEYKKRYNKLLSFIKKEYYKKCRDTIGLKYLKNGKEIYKSLIKSYCKYNISPEFIHKYGKKEIKRLTKLLKKEKKKITYCNNKKEIIDLYKSNYDNIKKSIMPKYFNYELKTKCNIRPIEKYMENSIAFAFYNEKLRTFYLNTKLIKGHAKEDTYTLTMHEAEPGHHYQFTYMLEKKIPLYKIYSISNVAFIEGWALYTETLGPQNYASIMTQIFRATRLVVDTGIHYYGWTFKKAFNYMKKHISFSDNELKSETYRYICIPGQAVSYYIGKRLILQLRKLYIDKYKLGDIKDFHDFILEDGVMTFDYLFKKIEKLRSKNST